MKRPLYSTWLRIRKLYPICEHWKTFKNFEGWAISQNWTKGLIVIRKDNELEFTPENCILVNRYSINKVKHGKVKHPLYQIWIRIKRQCYMKSASDYLGGKIKLDKSWCEFQCFYDWCESKRWEKGLTVVRIDLNKDFNPENCILKLRSEISGDNGRISGIKCKGRKVSLSVMEKKKKTCLERYGTEFPQKLDFVKEKYRQKCLDKYGVDNTSQLESTKKKARQTCMEKYGVDHHTKTEGYKKRQKQITIDNGKAYFYEGKDSEQWAADLGISRSCFNARARKYGLEVASSMEKYQSELETLMENMLIKNNIKYQKQIKVDKYFADFLLSDYNLIIETDGLYWHSDLKKEDKSYHKTKQIKYREHGYNSMFFREDEINCKIEIIESIILNKCKQSIKIMARKCDIKPVDRKMSKLFLNENHLMGCGSGQTFGLFYGNELVTLIQVTCKNGILDISRFCNKKKTSVTGGFTKLLKYLTEIYKPNSITTFIDKRYGSGEYLKELGFQLINESLSFKWVKDDKTFHRMRFPSNSGYQLGYYKIWDCGQAKYKKIIDIQH